MIKINNISSYSVGNNSNQLLFIQECTMCLLNLGTHVKEELGKHSYSSIQALNLSKDQVFFSFSERSNVNGAIGIKEKTKICTINSAELIELKDWVLKKEISSRVLLLENYYRFSLYNSEINSTKWEADFGYFSPSTYNPSNELCVFAEVPNVRKLKLVELNEGKVVGDLSIDEINKVVKSDSNNLDRSSGLWINDSLFFTNDLGEIILIDSSAFIPIKKIFSPHPNGQWGEYYHDTSRNKLVKFINKTIHEVDLDTHEIEFFEPARFKDKDAEPNGGKWEQDETYIYYCSLDGTTVNALNKKTKEIDWQHQHNQNAADLNIVKEVPVRYRNVQYHQGRLFVMDNKRNLHIFEEKDMPTKVTS